MAKTIKKQLENSNETVFVIFAILASFFTYSSMYAFRMPFATGLIFGIPLLISVWLLDQLPPPREKDIQNRTARVPMSKNERYRFLQNFSMAILPFTVVYIFLTVLRDIRDNFAAEIWISLGKGDTPSIFTTSEIPVGIGVLIVISLMILIKNNLKALNASIGLIIIGLAVNMLATAAFRANLIGGVFWMIAVGFGLYLGYIAYHALLLKRFIANFKYVRNIGFLFYIADAFGYLGSVSSFMLKNFFTPHLSWVNFFSTLTYSLSLTGIALCVVTWVLIRTKHRRMFPDEYALILNRKK